MPIHDFKCPAGHIHDALVKHDVLTQECPECGNPAERVFLRAPQLNYLAMGAQENVSPEFQKRWDQMHRKQKAKEEKSLSEHGDYGASHGFAKPIGE